MRAIGPVNVSLVYETDVSFVDERGSLKSVTFSFAAHVTACEPVQFVIDQRIQLIQGGLVSIAPLSEKLGYFMLLRWSFQSVATLCLILADLARLTQHLVHFTDVELLFSNHAASVLFEQNRAVAHQL